MTNRPDFKQIKSFGEFSKYYWYREELQKICKSLGLDSSGMKAELNHVIEEYFKGNLIYPEIKRPNKAVKQESSFSTFEKSRRTKNQNTSDNNSSVTEDKERKDRPLQKTFSEEKNLYAKLSKSPKSQDISLQTGLIECNFSFSQHFRDFFSKETGIKPFKFNVDMVATARKIRECGDTSFTLGDLLDIFYGRKTYAKYDKVSLQWNKFVKDFCADPATASFPNKLKVAAALWKEVRESTREKMYRHELLEEFCPLLLKLLEPGFSPTDKYK